MRPLIGSDVFQVEGAFSEEGAADLWAQQAGTIAQKAEVKFK
ncbi:hypothetical protein OURE66S_02399 [Oligella ureolytica]